MTSRKKSIWGNMITVLVVGKTGYEHKLDLCMVARAFGASSITFSPDDKESSKRLERACKALRRDWGGVFAVSSTNNWKGFMKDKKNYLKVYLTRYGIPVKKLGYQIRTYKNVLVVVSIKESVKQLYKAADFNMSITTQPHSCASAIAVFLHSFYDGRELAMHFENARYRITPDDHGIRIQKEK